MSTLSQVVKQLHAQRKKVQSELVRFDAALDALRGTHNGSRIHAAFTKPRRRISAAGRRRIVKAQRARWAAWKAKQKKAA